MTMTNMEKTEKEMTRKLDDELLASGLTSTEEREEITSLMISLSESIIKNAIKGFKISAVTGALVTGICVGKSSGIWAGLISGLGGGIIIGILGIVIAIKLTIRKIEKREDCIIKNKEV